MMDKKWILREIVKYKFSINLVMRKPEYRTNAVNYPFVFSLSYC